MMWEKKLSELVEFTRKTTEAHAEEVANYINALPKDYNITPTDMENTQFRTVEEIKTFHTLAVELCYLCAVEGKRPFDIGTNYLTCACPYDDADRRAVWAECHAQAFVDATVAAVDATLSSQQATA